MVNECNHFIVIINVTLMNSTGSITGGTGVSTSIDR